MGSDDMVVPFEATGTEEDTALSRGRYRAAARPATMVAPDGATRHLADAMAPLPKLVPAAPTRGEPVEVDRSPWWIGSSAGSALRVYLPGVADRHASITEREDGYYLSPMPGAAIMLNGRPVSAATRLADGVIVEISPAARWEFVTGEPRIVAAPEP
ncbi:MAG: FHA domain-containing protein, partial [Gemmatimonadales bacterium]